MKRPFIELTFHETYYFSNLIKNVLEDQFSYLRKLDEFYGDNRYLSYTSAFPRFSAFHSFIHFLIADVVGEDVLNMKLDIRQDDAERFKAAPRQLEPHPSKLPVNLAFDRFGIDHQSFDGWLNSRGTAFVDATDGDVYEYYDELRLNGQMDELLDRTTDEVFFVLFQNRHVLLLFNEMMAKQVSQGTSDASIEFSRQGSFARHGVLRRLAMPAWAWRAIFFRDRGMCVICAKDLSGILAIASGGSEENYDHIVPLAEGGLNDVTNLQLLCRQCNSTKRAGQAATSNRYQAWYPQNSD